MYEGKKVYVDHPTRETMQDDRKFADWAGIIKNPRYEGGAVYGDIHLRQKSRHYDELIEAAEKFHGAFGLSHVADGESRMQGGTEVIESITDVFSVDIVTDPATTAGLFESVSGNGAAAGQSCRDVVDAIEQLVAEHGDKLPEQLVDSFNELAGLASTFEKMQAAEPEPEEPELVQESYHTPFYGKALEASHDLFDFSTPGSFAARYR